VVALVQLTGAA